MVSVTTDDSLEQYRENLEHVVRPDKPSERPDDQRVYIDAWEALALKQGFREYAAYNAPDSERESIAMAYVEYIDMLVYHEEREVVYLYAHTGVAREVLSDAASCAPFEVSEHLLSRVRRSDLYD